MTNNKQDTPKITASAIRYPSGMVLVGRRHYNIIKLAANKFDLDSHNSEQGFITSNRDFVDRDTAASIAMVSRQVDEFHEGELYSEDLW